MIGHEKKQTGKRAVGVLQIAISGFAFGFLGIFGKLAFRNGLSLGELLSYRFLVATLMMALGLAIFSPHRLRIGRRDVLICAGLGLFGYAVFSSFYFAAIRGVSVAMASLLLYTYPVLVALGARLFFGQRLTRAQLIALPLAALGLFVLLAGDVSQLFEASAGSGATRPFAIASGLASALCYAGYILVSSRFQNEIDPLTSGFYVMMFAALGLFVFHRPDLSRVLTMTAAQAWVLAGIALVCTVTPLVLFLSGLQKLGNTEASLLSTIEPVTAAFMGSLLLQEALSIREWLGGTIVLAALVATVLGAKNAPPVPRAEALD